MLCVEVEENIKITLIDAPSRQLEPPPPKDTFHQRKDDRSPYVKYSPLLRRTHAKALSVGDPLDEGDVPKSFSQNRELWQQRASSHSSVNSVGLSAKEMPRDLRPKQTPDLVMDLPMLEAAKSPEETDVDVDDAAAAAAAAASQPESPDMALAAERFAKQNQCTLKKNTRDVRHRNEKTDGMTATGASFDENSSSSSSSSPQLSPATSKPQIKAKPQLLRKPLKTPTPTLPLHSMRKEHGERE